MSIRINAQPPGSRQSQRSLESHKTRIEKSLEKLGSGHRINRASDDAAGLAIAQKLGQAIAGLEQGMRNTDDGLSLAQTADGALAQVGENLGRMRELAMTASNGTLNEEQRAAVQDEFSALRDEVDRVADSTEFNGTRLLDGSAGAVDVTTGTVDGEAISLDLSRSAHSAALGLAGSSVDGADGSAALEAMEKIDGALAQVDSYRSDLGAGSNRLVSAQRELAIASENAYGAQSRMLDLDYALEASNLLSEQILAHSTIAAMAQGRGLSATALNLLE